MNHIPYIETPTTALRLVRPRHREIMRRLVCGQSQKEIAQEMGLHVTRLSQVVNSPLFQIELKKMEREITKKTIEKVGDVTERVAKLQGPALDVLEKIIKDPEDSRNARLRRDAAMDILTMSGLKNGKKNDDGMTDFAQFINDAFVEAKERAINKLNEGLEAASIQENETEQLQLPPVVINPVEAAASNEPLSIDDAEDMALMSFDAPVIDVNDITVPATKPGSTHGVEHSKATDQAAELMVDLQAKTKIKLDDKTQDQLFRILKAKGIAGLKDVAKILNIPQSELEAS